MKLTIIVPLHNGLEFTKGFFLSLQRLPPLVTWDIIWVDDLSTDGTREWLNGLVIRNHHIILNRQRLRYAANNNLGAKMADGDILLFLNNDIILSPNWIAPLMQIFERNENLGVIGNIQLQPATGRIDHAGICFDLIGLPDHHLKNRALSAAHGNGCFVPAVTAACCMIRRDLFLSVGGFDERYRNGCEDVDLCLRLGEMGYRHWVDYRSVIYHHVSSSPGRKDHENRNLALFLRRWGHLTSKWGQEDWPRNYLSKHLHCPWKLNGTKTVDALLRLAGLKHGDSKWAAEMRHKIMAQVPAEGGKV
jgi:GT2 family glycosyltransferase